MNETPQEFALRLMMDVKKEGLEDEFVRAETYVAQKRYLEAIHSYDYILSMVKEKETEELLRRMRRLHASSLKINYRDQIISFIILHNDSSDQPNLIDPRERYIDTPTRTIIKTYRALDPGFPESIKEGDIRAMIVRANSGFFDLSGHYYEWGIGESPENTCILIALFDLDKKRRRVWWKLWK
jgi:hypothetical protein